MTPEEYIEQLKQAARMLQSVNSHIDNAVQNMEWRLEKGYEHFETTSKKAASVAAETASGIAGILKKLSEIDIEY